MGTRRKINERTEENYKIYKNRYGENIIGDGNCFYRCLSYCLFGHQHMHEQMRHKIIQFMSDDELLPKAEKIKRYRKLMPKNMKKDDYDLYLKLHSKIGTWAEDPIIQASADIYYLYLFVLFYKNRNEVQRMIAKPVQAGRKNCKSIFLKLENCHFTIAKDQKELPGELWFDLLLTCADGPEQYEYSSLALDYNKNFTSKSKELEPIENFKYTDILSDENSFQRCLAYFLYGDQENHDQIRMETIEFMSGDELLSKTDKLKRYGKLMDKNDDYYSYLTLHSQDGERAEDPIMQASADKYGLSIFVYLYRNSNCIQRMGARPLHPRRDNSKIFLKFENYHFTFAKDQFELPGEVWFDLLFPLTDRPEQLDDNDSLDLDNIIFMETEEARDFKNLKDKKKITKELKRKWNFKAGEEPTGDVHYIANLIAGENLPGKNGSA